MLAAAIARDGTEVVIDLSGVEFMDAATVGVIVRAREFLQAAIAIADIAIAVSVRATHPRPVRRRGGRADADWRPSERCRTWVQVPAAGP